MSIKDVIILSSTIIGSVYLFSNTMHRINKKCLENGKYPFLLYMIDGFTIIASGSLYIYFSIKSIRVSLHK